MTLETQLRQTFEQLAHEVGASRDAWPHLESRIARGSRLRLVWRVAIAGAFAIIAAILVPQLMSSESPQRLDISKPVDSFNVYRDSRYGFSLRYPDSWHVQAFDTNLRVRFEGVLVTNIDHTFTHPRLRNGATSEWDFKGLPKHVIVVRFQHTAGGPVGFGPSPESDTRFPLSLDNATKSQTGPFGLQSDGRPSTYYLGVTFGGDSRYFLNVWLGPEASDRDKRLARDIVSSITFG